MTTLNYVIEDCLTNRWSFYQSSGIDNPYKGFSEVLS